MMAESNEKEDLKDFLRRVDELEAVVKGESLQLDENGRSEVDRTVINKDAFKAAKTADTVLDQESFIKSIESDAATRAARRRARTKVAIQLKEDGNKAFKEGDYEGAVKRYSEGLEQIKDMVVLYTNRAQAYINLQRYTEAISDCETALMLDPAFTKAYVNKGRALVGQKQYDQAINTYSEVIKHNPKQQKIVNEYIRQAEQATEANTAETKAQKAFQADADHAKTYRGEYIRQAEQAKEANAAETKAQKAFLAGDDHANNMVEVLEKLRKEGKPTVYYGGGLAVLADMLKDDVSRTLFRTHNGLGIFTENRTISGAFTKVLKGSKGVVELELVIAAIDLMGRSIVNNDENLSRLLKFPTFPDTMTGLLGCPSDSVAYKSLTLLLKISFRSVGLKGILANFDIQRLMAALLSSVQTRNSGSEECVKLLNNLATEDKFTQQFRDNVEEKILPSFENLLANHAALSLDILSSCLSFLGNMVHDPVIRRKVQERTLLLDSVCQILKCHCETSSKVGSQGVVLSLLALLINVTLDTSLSSDQSENIAACITTLFDCDNEKVVERSLTLYSRLVPQSPAVIIGSALDTNLAETLLSFIRDGRSSLFKGCIKVLALLTQGSTEIRERIVSNKKDLERVCELLDQDDDTTVANTALCLTHCFDVKESLVIMEDTDIVRTLLKKTDTTNPTIKQNSAIALAKLAMGSQRHLERLRELGGIGILHSCMKHVR